MSYAVSDVVSEILILMDESGIDRASFLSNEDSSTNLVTIVKTCLKQAYRSCLLTADTSLLDGSVYDTSAVTVTKKAIGSYYAGCLDLPADFLRLVVFKMSDWSRGVKELLNETSQGYSMQQDSFSCGTMERPTAALVHSATGKRQLEYFTSSEAATISKFIYLKEPCITDTIEISDKIKYSLYNYTIYMVLSAYRDSRAEFYLTLAKEGLTNV